MSWTTPAVTTVGQLVTSSFWNAQIYGNILALTGLTTGATVSGANTDIAAPTTIETVIEVGTGGGSVRSIGAAPLNGSTLTIANKSSSYVSLLHQTSGGSGAELSLRDALSVDLYPGESLTLVYDGTYWTEINRNFKTVLAYAENGSNVTVGTGGNTTLVTLPSVTYGANTPIQLEFNAPLVEPGTQPVEIAFSAPGSTAFFLQSSAGALSLAPILAKSTKVTPSAGAIAHYVFAEPQGSTYVIFADGQPLWLKAVRA